MGPSSSRRLLQLCAAALAVPPALARAPLLAPTRVIDGHVHLTDISLFDYLWANQSAGPCPCAPPCLCNWTVTEWRDASASVKPSYFVFVEVDVNHSQWFDEAAWVQSLASGPGGSAVGAIVAQPPPGFGTATVPVSEMAAELDKFAALPLVHGVRPSVPWSSLNATTFAPLLAHTRLLAVGVQFIHLYAVPCHDVIPVMLSTFVQTRGLSFDLNAAMGSPGVATVREGERGGRRLRQTACGQYGVTAVTLQNMARGHLLRAPGVAVRPSEIAVHEQCLRRRS
jgi:hypothetical protein